MPSLEWQIGDPVLVRGLPWTIREVTIWRDCSVLRLNPSTETGCARSLLTPFDRPKRLDPPRGLRVVRPRRWLHDLRRTSSTLTPYGGAIAVARAAVRLMPHQIEPLLAMLRHGANRLLIADAVGLGKTIQAGLILLELAARAEDFRAVVLVPAGLRDQWRQELSERFGLASIQADAAWLRASVSERPVDVNPWSLPGIYIASIDFAKRPEVLRALEDVTWDLMVLDEAHLASASSDRRAAAHAIASRSLRTVLLTATPDAADDPLSQIGALDPIESAAVLFRRTRANVQDCTPRRSAFLRITPTAAERRMHDLLERYTRQIWRESVARGDARAKLVTIVLRKRALSSAGSLALSVERRLELMTAASAPAERQLLLPLADEDPLSDAMQDDDLAAPGLADARKERRWLGAIAEAARDAARAESKAVRLLRWLARVHEPVIVFTEYRDTLRALERLIRATGRPLTTLHGGLERADRVRAQAIFNAGGVSLLATDAAAEGLNLHHHCRIVLHYELPWRPSRIEQRAGRVDRLGQSRRVHEIALVAAGTAERLVLAPLVSRAARARAVGDTAGGLLDSLSESTVSDLIIGGVPLPAAPGVRDSTERTADLRAEAIAEVVRLETIRRSVSESPEPGLRRRETKTVIVTAMKGRRSSFGRGLVLVFAQTLTDRVGRRVHSEPLVLFVTLVKRAEWGHRESLRRLVLEIDSLARHSETAIGRLRDADLTQIASRVVPLHDGACDALHRREELMRHRLPSAATQMVQAGLFDRRALSNSMRRKEVREAQIEVLEATGQAIERSTSLVPATHLAAVLLVC